jgi:hypothetical protein
MEGIENGRDGESRGWKGVDGGVNGGDREWWRR